MQTPAKVFDILDSYTAEPPTPQSMLDIFGGEWTSLMPPPFSALRAGSIPLFEDSRVHWMIQMLGGVQGYRVLELGPLEGGHTYTLDRAGVASTLSIESNQRAFLKCLIAKELLSMKTANFVYGDFRAFFEDNHDRYDLCVASGVLYHMHDPVDLLFKLGQRVEKLFLWTHYFDPKIISANPNLKNRFGDSLEKQTGDFKHRLYRFNYLEALDSKGFCGGSARYSHWIARETLFDALKYAGFAKFEVGIETPDHPHGPSFCVIATK